MKKSFIELKVKEIGDEFKKLYLEEKLSLDNISKHFNICNQTTNKIVQYLNLSRDKGEVKSNSLIKGGKKAKHFNDLLKRISKEDIIEYYILQDHEYYETLKHFDVTDWSFCKLLKYYNIDRKDKSKVSSKAYKKKIEQFGSEGAYYEYRLDRRNSGIVSKYGSLDEFYKIKSNRNKEKWSQDYYEILRKINNTKENNNSFNKSKPEDKYYEYLLDKFKDVKRQYRDSRYMFNCDFYIPELDLFIELNFNWTHGSHPYDPLSEIDQQTLTRWKEKSISSKFYRNAIHTWTVLDVQKFKSAKENNLNYLVFYNEEEAYSYFERIKNDK